MPYIDDLVASGEAISEIFNAQSKDLIKLVSKETAETMFPGVKLNESENIKYFPFKLCHSYPAVNARGRTFMPKVLANSFASLNDQLVDMNHMLRDNEFPSDRIVGCVKATAFTPPKATNGEVATANLEPVPVRGLGVLFLRAHGVREIVEEHETGKLSYGISMECGHKWKDAVLSYRGEFIPIMDAEVAARDCIQKDGIKQYKGHALAACLGGMEGSVDFWGCAITASPADDKADILNFFSVQSKEAASRKKFYMPMRAYDGKELEIAHTTVDKKLSEEIASIDIIGQTEPDELDGHTHFILSDLTILPANGHVHYFRSQSISRGTTPTLTGITDAHHYYPPSVDGNSSPPIAHMHLVKVPLKGKLKDGASDESTTTTEIEVASMSKTMKEMAANLKALMDNKGKATDDAAKSHIDKEVASAVAEILNSVNQEDTEKARNDFVEQLIKDGKLVKKEVADALVTDAVKVAVDEETKKHEAELKANQIKQSRIEKCMTAGIDLETQFGEEFKDEKGQPLTLRNRLESHSLDDAGERNFNLDFAMWQKLVGNDGSNTEGTENQGAATGETVPVGAGAGATESANNGKNVKKPKVLSLVSGGTKSKEAAEKPIRQKAMVGKSRFLVGK